jgi:hypothetical protein
MFNLRKCGISRGIQESQIVIDSIEGDCMKAKALDRYPVPRYPTRPQVEQNPKLTQRSLSSPVRHLLETGISGAMALLVPLSGCDRNPAGTAAAPSSQQVEGQTPSTTGTPTKPKISCKALLVAPIFDHGTGRGSTGCVVVSPPVFLSEEEAMTIIKEELSKSGIILAAGKTIFPKVQMHKEIGHCSDGRGTCKPLQMDLQDSTGHIHIEYFSKEDNLFMTEECPPKTVWMMSTVQSYDPKGMAEQMRTGLQKRAGRGVFGVFYDPLVSRDMLEMAREMYSTNGQGIFRRTQSEFRAEAKELLRQQVQDFAQWLADQKVIDGKNLGTLK